MKLQHFYSDWNGLESKQPYNSKPTNRTINLAIKNGGKAKYVHDYIFVNLEHKIVEVKKATTNGYTTNLYRDIYRILE